MAQRCKDIVDDGLLVLHGSSPTPPTLAASTSSSRVTSSEIKEIFQSQVPPPYLMSSISASFTTLLSRMGSSCSPSTSNSSDANLVNYIFDYRTWYGHKFTAALGCERYYKDGLISMAEGNNRNSLKRKGRRLHGAIGTKFGGTSIESNSQLINDYHNADLRSQADTGDAASSGSSLFFNKPQLSKCFEWPANAMQYIDEISRSRDGEGSLPLGYYRSNGSVNRQLTFHDAAIDSNSERDDALFSRSSTSRGESLSISSAAVNAPVTSTLEQMDWALLLSSSNPKPSESLSAHFDAGREGKCFKELKSLLDDLLGKVSTNTGSNPSILSLPLSQDTMPSLATVSSSSSSSVEPSPASSPSSCSNSSRKNLSYINDQAAIKLPPNGEFGDSIRRSTLQLYYSTLERILEKECERLQNSKLPLISNNAFHRSLFACCAEAVLFSKSCYDLKFPHVLKACEVDTVTFFKCIETFVRHSSLPPSLKKHMSSVEESILVKHAWEDDCPLYDMITESKRHPMWPPIILRTGADELDPQKAPVVGDSERDTSSNHSASYQVVALFFTKLVDVAQRKIIHLCSSLGIDEYIADLIWTVFKYALTDKVEIFRGRHIDPIIMCCVYCVYKSVRPSPNHMPFASIIKSYKLLYPERTAENYRIVRDIVLDGNAGGGDDKVVRGDLIAFNNRVFGPALKDFISNFRTLDAQQAAIREFDAKLRRQHEQLPIDNERSKVAAVRSAPCSKVATPVGSPMKRKAKDDCDTFINNVYDRRHKVPIISKISLKKQLYPACSGSPARVENSNVYVVASGASSTFPGRMRKCRSRVLFEFGSSGKEELALVNETVQGGCYGLPPRSDGEGLSMPHL